MEIKEESKITIVMNKEEAMLLKSIMGNLTESDEEKQGIRNEIYRSL